MTIREVRSAEGLSAEQLAAAVGITLDHLHAIEDEARVADPGVLDGIAQRLRCDVRAFFRAGSDRPQNGYAMHAIRTRRGREEVDLAATVGVSRPHLRNVEHEYKSAKAEVIARIATDLGCSIAALTRGGGAYVIERRRGPRSEAV